MARHDIQKWQAGLSPEERSELAREAAAASAAARRQHRLFKNILKDVLTCPVSDDDAIKAQLERLGLEPTFENAMMLAAAHKAKAGDVEAIRFVRDTVGEKPTEAFNLSVMDKPVRSLDLERLSDQEIEALADQSDEGQA